MARNAACSAIADEVTRLTREIEPIMRRFRDEGAKLDEKQQRRRMRSSQPTDDAEG